MVGKNDPCFMECNFQRLLSIYNLEVAFETLTLGRRNYKVVYMIDCKNCDGMYVGTTVKD